MNVEQLRTWIAPISQLIAVIVVAGTLVIWGLRLQDKVERLEGQVQVLLTSPSASVQPSSASSKDAASSPSSTDQALPTACASLAEKVATAASSTVIPSSAIREIKSLMADLGCMAKTQK
jgi:hypothetical protein